MYLTGSTAERQYTGKIRERLPPEQRARTHLSAGELSMSQFIDLLRSVDLFITTDSGPYHIATQIGVPTLSLWGPGSPFQYGITDAPLHGYVWQEFSCSPCMYSRQRDAGKRCGKSFDCMRAITVEQVFKRFSKQYDLLRESRTATS